MRINSPRDKQQNTTDNGNEKSYIINNILLHIYGGEQL
jgi:hypothetical protein